MSSSLSSSHHHDDWHDDDDINDSSGESSDDLAEHSDIKKPNRKKQFQKSKSLKKSSRKLNKSKSASASASASEITTTDSGRESVEHCKKNDKTDDDGKSNTTDGVVVSKKTNNDAIPADADADNESTDVEEKDEENKSNADDDDVTSKKDEEIKSNTDEGVVTSKKTYDNISADIEGKKNKDEETKSNTDEDVVTSKNTKDDAIPAADVEGKKKKDEENSNNSVTEDNVVMSKKTNDNAIPAVEGKKKKDEENKSNTNDDDVVMSKKTNGDAISAVEGKKNQDEENNSDTDDDDIVMSTKNSNDDAESSKNDNEKMKADNKDNDEKKGPSSATSDEKKTGPGTTTSDSKLSNDAASDLVHFLHSTPIENGSRNKYSSSKSTDTTTTATTATMKENETGASKVNKDEKKGDDDDAEITAENTVDDRSTIATKEEEDHDQEDGRDNMEAIGASRKQRIIYSKRRDDDVHIDPAATATATATATTVKEKRKSKPLPSSKKKAAAPAPAPSVAPATAGRGAASTDATKKLSQQVIIETTYRNNVTASNNDLQRSSQFPFRLHNMLDDAERTGHSHIVSWSPGGESFKIHLPKQLINVLQKYFRQSKFKSFLRQLQGYDFKRITRGKDQGVVSHPMFLRGRRSACTLMKRKRVVPRGEQPAQQAKVGQASASTSTIATGAAATGIAAKSAAKDTVARNHRGIPITNRRKRQPLAINHVKNAAPTGAGMMYSGSNSGNSNVQTYSSTQHHQIPQHLGQGQQQPTRYSMHHYPVSTAHHQRHLYLHEGPMKNGMQSQQQLHQQQLHERQQQHPYPNHQNMMTMTPGTYDAAAAMATTKQSIMIINPDPQDVLCVDVPNVEQFQGNKKLSSIAQKITSHFISANESVKAMIVNEISSRIQKGGSRFLKLTEDGRNWMECNEEEINLKVISCFELEAPAPTTIKSDLSVGSIPNSMIGSAVVGLKPDLSIPGNINSDSIVGTSSDTRRRIQYPPSDKDVVLRGGPSSEKEGNTYLITMIQANVGQQVDSFEMKRIKCRAILDRMSKRGSRFFLKLKETDTDDDLYCLSDTEAQDVIFTAFCAEEKKIQSLMASNNAAASVRHNRVESNAALLESQLGSRMLQGDAALLNSIRSSSNNGMLSSQAATQSAYLANRSLAGGKRPLENSDHLPPDVYEKRLRADTDEQVKMLIEVARQERDGSFGLAGRLPYARQPPIADTPSSNTSTGNASMEKLLKDRDDLLRNQLGYAPSTSIRDLPTNNEINANNNQFVEFLKKKYVGNPKVSW